MADLAIASPAQSPMFALENRPFETEGEEVRGDTEGAKRRRRGGNHRKLPRQADPDDGPREDRSLAEVLGRNAVETDPALAGVEGRQPSELEAYSDGADVIAFRRFDWRHPAQQGRRGEVLESPRFGTLETKVIVAGEAGRVRRAARGLSHCVGGNEASYSSHEYKGSDCSVDMTSNHLKFPLQNC